MHGHVSIQAVIAQHMDGVTTVHGQVCFTVGCRTHGGSCRTHKGSCRIHSGGKTHGGSEDSCAWPCLFHTVGVVEHTVVVRHRVVVERTMGVRTAMHVHLRQKTFRSKLLICTPQRHYLASDAL